MTIIIVIITKYLLLFISTLSNWRGVILEKYIFRVDHFQWSSKDSAVPSWRGADSEAAINDSGMTSCRRIRNNSFPMLFWKLSREAAAEEYDFGFWLSAPHARSIHLAVDCFHWGSSWKWSPMVEGFSWLRCPFLPRMGSGGRMAWGCRFPWPGRPGYSWLPQLWSSSCPHWRRRDTAAYRDSSWLTVWWSRAIAFICVLSSIVGTRIRDRLPLRSRKIQSRARRGRRLIWQSRWAVQTVPRGRVYWGALLILVYAAHCRLIWC